jgi:hypothetical protein
VCALCLPPTGDKGFRGLVVDVREHAIIPNKKNVPVTAVARFLQNRSGNERYVFVTVRILAEKCTTEPYEKLKKTDETICPCVR